jgi:hypothetical protein
MLTVHNITFTLKSLTNLFVVDMHSYRSTFVCRSEKTQKVALHFVCNMCICVFALIDAVALHALLLHCNMWQYFANIMRCCIGVQCGLLWHCTMCAICGVIVLHLWHYVWQCVSVLICGGYAVCCGVVMKALKSVIKCLIGWMCGWLIKWWVFF